MFRKRRASSSATNAIPCGLASNRTAMPLYRAVRNAQPRRHKRSWFGCLSWFWRRRHVGVHRVGNSLLPFFLFRLGFLGAGFMLALEFRDLLLLLALNQRQRAPRYVNARCLARTGEPDDCYPQSQGLGP